MRIVELMTASPASLPPDTSVEEALLRLAELEVRHLPVLEEGRLVGIVSDRDLLATTGGVWTQSSERRLRDVMHEPVTALPQDTLVMVAADMNVRKIGCVPIVDDDGTLLGLLTETDLMRAFVEGARTGALSDEADPPVSSWMSSPPHVLARESTLEFALRKAQSLGFRHLPVVAEGELVGIVSDRDLCREIGRVSPTDKTVERIMSRDVLTASQDDRLSHAAALMLDHKISGLPVTDAGALVGVLSSSDLVEHCLATLWQPDAAPPSAR